MGDKCFFLSDIHLGSDKEPKSFVLIQFLKQFKSTQDITKLFLVGDIFDMWLADHAFYIRRYKNVIDEFIRIKKMGVDIYFFEGNHDMYLEHYFEKKMGFHICKGPEVFNLCHLKVRVEHGDQMDPEDYGYRALRWFWRTPLLKWLAPRVPESMIVKIGDGLSKASREYNSEIKVQSDERARQILRRHARIVWMKEPFDLLVTGHTHVTDDYKLLISEHNEIYEATYADQLVGDKNARASARVINLGSWFDQPKVFVLSEDRAEFLNIS